MKLKRINRRLSKVEAVSIGRDPEKWVKTKYGNKSYHLTEDEWVKVLQFRKKEQISLFSDEIELLEIVENDGNPDMDYISGNAFSLDELLEHAHIDLDIWEVESFDIKQNSWDVSMKNVEKDLKYAGNKKDGRHIEVPGGIVSTNEQFYIKAKIVKKKDFTDVAIKKLIETIPEFKFSHFIPKYKKGSGIALEMATFDAHFGKLAWLGEVVYRNYDTLIASEDYEYAVDKNLNWSSSEKIEKIFYIVGQDMFHVDNMGNHTTTGDHQMDVDGRIPKIFAKAFEIVVKSIYKCRSVAPVEIIWSPGNHDYLTSFALCFALDQHFKNDKFVEVDLLKANGLVTRKARLWGNLLVGWTHRIKGKENTWGNELAQQFPELWGKSVFREWHCGDQHQKKNTKTMPLFTSGGVLIRQITALSPVDKWHFENVFTDAVPGGDAFLWSKDCGVFANYTAWTGQYDKYRNKLIKENKD